MVTVVLPDLAHPISGHNVAVCRRPFRGQQLYNKGSLPSILRQLPLSCALGVKLLVCTVSRISSATGRVVAKRWSIGLVVFAEWGDVRA